MEKKPILFLGACIFSMMGSILGLWAMLFGTLFFRYTSGKIVLLTNYTATEHLSPLYFATLMGAYSLSLAGAIKLYRMQRTGLYFYLTAQVLILFIPVIALGANAFSVINVLFTLLFSGVYVYYFRRLS